MKAKDKAQELLEKFTGVVGDEAQGFNCVLCFLDEIILDREGDIKPNSDTIYAINYWKKVKKELEWNELEKEFNDYEDGVSNEVLDNPKK